MAEEKAHHEGKAHGGGGGHGAHGGGGHEEGHEGAPEWLISFADNVALLMGFFVILLAMNMKEPTSGGIGGKDKNGGAPPNNRVIDMAIAIREAFNSPVDMSSKDPNDAPLIRRILERRAEGTAHDPGAKGNREDVQAVRPGSYYSPGGVVHFDDGVSAISDNEMASIRAIAKVIRGRRVWVEVKGHVSAAEAFRQVDKGMRLSFERALSVARALEAEGVEWASIRIVAAGDNDRLSQFTYDKESHRTNQRAEVFITDVPLPDDPYAKDQSAPAGPASAPAPAKVTPDPEPTEAPAELSAPGHG